jgi:hypothetical protein
LGFRKHFRVLIAGATLLLLRTGKSALLPAVNTYVVPKMALMAIMTMTMKANKAPAHPKYRRNLNQVDWCPHSGHTPRLVAMGLSQAGHCLVLSADMNPGSFYEMGRGSMGRIAIDRLRGRSATVVYGSNQSPIKPAAVMSQMPPRSMRCQTTHAIQKEGPPCGRTLIRMC